MGINFKEILHHSLLQNKFIFDSNHVLFAH